MEDQVPFKVVTYWGQREDSEIRRFGVEKSLVTSFVYVNAKLQEVFPGLKTRSYSVSWIDEENDHVTVSSDDEMMIALTAMRGSLIKLYIYCNDVEKDDDCDIIITAAVPGSSGDAAKQGSSKPDKDATHYGVVCDGCDTPVVGFRYKCTSCMDYDLCSKCEASGLHPEHCMVRIPAPSLPRQVIKAAIKRSRQFLKTVVANVGEECPYKKHRREKSGERKHRDSDREGHHHRDRHHRRSRGSWLETFATYMNEFANLAGDIDLSDPTEKPQEAARPEQKTGEQKAPENATPEQSSNEAPKQSPPTFKPQCPAGLLNADNIQKLMQMYFNNFEHLIPKPSTSAASSDASVNTNDVTTNNASVNTGDVEMAGADKPESDKASVKSEGSSASKRDESPDKADDWTMINKEKDLLDAYVKQEGAAAPFGFNLPAEFHERLRLAEGQSLYPPLNAATAVLNPKEPERVIPSAPQQYPVTQPAMAQPTVAQPQPTVAQPQPTAAQPQPTVTQPQPFAAWPQPQAAQPQPKAAPQPQPRARHPKPHIDAAIEQMLNMGFTNEGGWLGQLLESKDGNIAAVLDLLTPVNPKTKK